MAKIALVYFNAGGGHRAAALALQSLMREQQRPWEVELVNLFEVLDPQGLFRKVMGFAPEDFYNKRLRHGWTLGLAQELKLLQGAIRMGHATLVRHLAPHWQRSAPDLVVSLVPNFNRALFASVEAARPGTPFVTVMTDLADLPPNFWVEPGQAQHVVCGTPRAAAQAFAMDYAASQVHLVSGMILRPDFYRPLVADRTAERRALGLDAETPVGVVLFGGQGSTVMRSIAKALADRPLILLCGHNERLADTLRALPASAPHVVVGYTSEVARYMRLGDYFVGKPGPGSMSEALHSGLPVIVTRNAWTMPQERYNTDWVHEQGVGLVLRSFGPIARAVDQLVADLPALRANVNRLDNRAVFEVVDVFAALLAGRAPSPARRGTVTTAS